MRFVFRSAMTLVFAFELSACASRRVSEVNALTLQYEQSIPRCETTKTCDVAWKAAREFVSQRSATPITSDTGWAIDTAKSSASSNLHYAILKKQVGTGTYELHTRIFCEALMGCKRDPFKEAIEFNNHVNLALKSSK